MMRINTSTVYEWTILEKTSQFSQNGAHTVVHELSIAQLYSLSTTEL